MATLGGAIQHQLSSSGDTQVVLSGSPSSWNDTCNAIERQASAASKVYYNHGSPNYKKDIRHWADSSTQFAMCSFEPGNPEDVGIAVSTIHQSFVSIIEQGWYIRVQLRVIAQTRTPFAVKGGGHNTNPGFSSTLGVQIAMSRFSDIEYDPTTQTATIGAGQLWDKVYEKLGSYDVSVVGGRLPGVGVAGFTLGGGYAWHTSQYGLTIDTVQGFQLVVPNGTVVDVTEKSSPDLFFSLRGGLNNFGVVTKFTFKTFEQKQVWGGFISYDASDIEKVNLATANFAADNDDPKAAILVMYNYVNSKLQPVVIIFYDAPEPPIGKFDEFVTPNSVKNLSTSDFYKFVRSLSPITALPSPRAISNSISVTKYSLSLIELIVNETTFWAQNLPDKAMSLISYHVEPFLPSLFTHSELPSAYPPDRTQGFLPLNIYYAWNSSEWDDVFHKAIERSAQMLEVIADTTTTLVYPNIAIFNTPLEKLYGTNVEKLKEIKGTVDRENVMSLTGGFKF